jgi:hypothetical protein
MTVSFIAARNFILEETLLHADYCCALYRIISDPANF